MQSKTYLPKWLACSMSALWLVSLPFTSFGYPFSVGNLDNHWWITDAGPNQNICLGESAQLQATGANSYTWSPATGLSCTLCPNPVASPSVTTTYFVLGDDGTSDSVVVAVFTQPQILSVIGGDPTDCNLPNGTIVVDADATGPLEYSINGGGIWQNNGFFTALTSGNYPVAIRHVGGACQTAGPTVTLQAPTAPQIFNISQTNPTLCDAPNGAIIVSATGTILPLQYSADGGFTWQNSNTFQLLTSGNYNVKVRNADGSCEIAGGIVSLEGSPDEPDITDVLVFGPGLCGSSDGLITVLVSNDNGNFEYSINGGASFQASNSFPNLTEGVYEIIVRQNNGTCAVNGGIFNLLSTNHPTIFGTSVIQPLGCGTNDGNITILAFGPSTLEFSVNGGTDWQLSNIFNGLSPGSYQVVVRNDDGTCSTNGDLVLLTAPVPPTINNVTPTNPTSCAAANGSIVIVATGAGALEYSIDGGNIWSTNNAFNNLAAGQYNIVVREIGGACTAIYPNNPVVLTDNGTPPTILNVNVNNPTGCGTGDGSISINASGTGLLEYSINDGVSYSTNPLFTGLSGGSYQVRVRDTGTSCVAIYQNNPVVLADAGIPPSINDVSVTQPSGCGAGDGVIDISAIGQNTLEYSIDNGVSYSPAPSFTGLSGGVYNISVRDIGTGCVAIFPNNPVVLVDVGTLPIVSNVAVTQPGSCVPGNGVILITASGSAPLEYSINDGATYSPNAAFTGLTGGNYIIRVRDTVTGCVGDYQNNPVVLDDNGTPPIILNVNSSEPTGCGALDGTIFVNATGANALEFSIDDGVTWNGGPAFFSLGAGNYNIRVRDMVSGCLTIYQNNPFQLTSPGNPPIVNNINTLQPSTCGATNGGITIEATGTGTLQYSINNGTSFQASNSFTGLAAGTYITVVALAGNICPVTTTVSLVDAINCTDTVSVTIPANATDIICLDPSVFDFPGLFSSVGFCGQGNAATVMATSIAGECVTVVPANGFTGTSPNLICTVHCFNNGAQCDTTYISVTVENNINCDPVFPVDTVTVPFVSSPTSYCVPIPFATLSNYNLFFQGVPVTNPFDCDLDQTIAYTYGFLPNGGTNGPYSLNFWLVNGVAYSTTFNDPQGLLEFMNDTDPNGFWQINAQGSIIFGGDPSTQYGNMEIVQVSTGLPTVLMTNFTFQPQGFTVQMGTPGEHLLVANDPTTGCSDTLVIHAVFNPPGPETITLTTTVNTPTAPFCLDGEDLPNGVIVNIGFCAFPSNGVAPIVTDSCVFYVPNLNFAGQDEFCMIVCDAGFPQICDTTFFIVNVLPEIDTVFLDIPPGANSVDTCLSNFIIELPGAIDQASFCNLNTSQLSGAVNGNCISFTPVNNFIGVSEVCVEFCSGGVCDQTIVFVNVAPPIICDDLFAQNTITIPSASPQGFLCVPVAPGSIVNYAATIDGNPYIAFAPCNFGNVLIYNYNAIPAGPVMLNSWTVNGVTFMGNFPNILTLIDSMNVWDPAGNWANNPFGQTINGGAINNSYGNLVISENLGGIFTISPDVVVLPLGSNMTINGYGSHQVILTQSNGCADTVTVILEQHPVTPETLFFETNLNTTVVPICANTDELLGNLQSFNFCGLPANGSVAIVGDTCVSYTPNLNFSGTDEFCLVVCDDNQPTVCDTVFVVVHTQLPTDTVFINATDVVPFDECLDGTVLQLPGTIATASICGSDPSAVTLGFVGNCVTIDLEDTFIGTTTACVVHCTADIPPICDTTILVISFDGMFPCDDIFDPDQVNVTMVNGVGEVCLPVSVFDINDYTVFLDGAVYAGQLIGCDVDSVYTYFYSQVFGQGNAGPYNIEWALNGVVQTATVADMVALVNLMNGLDPAGGWELDQNLLTISSTNDSGDYGLLEIFHPSGQVAGLTPNFNGMPNGTLVTFTGAGQHEVVLVENFTNCDDTLFINGVNALDTIQIFTIEGTPSDQTCIDTSGLPGNFLEMTVCGLPANGTLLLDNECFIYFPLPGFVGNDEACFQICDDLGNCEIWTVFITVDPLCAAFNFFPDGVIDIAAPDCAALAEYCIPIELDSMANFGVLDNGVTMSNFVSCNGNFTQISLDTGFHEIIVVHLMTQCADTLLLNVNCTPDDGCGLTNLSALDLLAVDCDSTVEFCVDLALIDLPNFTVTDNGNTDPQIGPCSFNNLLVGMALDTGFHELVFTDTVKGCMDTFLVNVDCIMVEDSTIDVEIVEGDSLEICLEDYGFPIASMDSLVNVCPGQSDGNATFEIDPTTWCVTVFGEIIGMDTFCFKAYFGDTCAILTANVNVISSCPDYFPDDQLQVSVSCNVDTSLVCLPMALSDFTNLVITVDGQVYSDTIQPCGFDSLLIFPFYQLPSMGIIGPYSVDEWTVNGTMFSGLFNSAGELATFMTLWDNTGDWTVSADANGNTIIVGGNFNSTYGEMTVTQILFGDTVSLGIQLQLTPTSYGILLPTGTSLVSFTDTLTNCTETVVADVLCVQTDTIIATILVGETDTLCLDLSELLGNVVSVENICDALGGTDVSFEIIGECVAVTGLDPGTDQACIVVCDDQNICDTTILIVTATTNSIDTLLIAVDDSRTMGEGTVLSIDVLQNDIFVTLSDFNIITDPAHGTAVFTPSGQINYVPDPGFCDDTTPDSLTYEICNAVACDTATVYILVLCDGLEIFTGFSPNEDGKNDFFKITGLQTYPDHHLFIYNRWGNLVYDATNYQSDWYGTWNGKDLPDGTYFYVLDLGEGEEPLSGYVQIHR